MHDRTTREVFEDHLRLAGQKDLEADLHNYASDIVILTGFGTYQGHDGVRDAARLLEEQIPDATYRYDVTLVSGEMAFLEWTATADGVRVEDGVDSFLIRDGKIRVQTIHYRLVKDEGA